MLRQLTRKTNRKTNAKSKCHVDRDATDEMNRSKMKNGRAVWWWTGDGRCAWCFWVNFKNWNIDALAHGATVLTTLFNPTFENSKSVAATPIRRNDASRRRARMMKMMLSWRRERQQNKLTHWVIQNKQKSHQWLAGGWKNGNQVKQVTDDENPIANKTAACRKQKQNKNNKTNKNDLNVNSRS